MRSIYEYRIADLEAYIVSLKCRVTFTLQTDTYEHKTDESTKAD